MGLLKGNTMSDKTLLLSDDGGVLTITVNRPDALNALNAVVLTELCTVLEGALPLNGGDLRGVILTGAGERAFVAGADIREMSVMTPDEGEAFGALGQRVTRLLEELPVPVIACVSGYALGGGCELAMAADFIYATSSAVFGQPEVSLGLIPGFGGCARLHHRVGPSWAKELIYTGRKIDALEARRIGLVNRVFDTREEMLDSAAATLAEIATRSPVAVSLCKSVIGDSVGRTTTDALDIEKAAFRKAFTTDDMREGTAAFLAKRPPSFPGH